MSVNTPISFQLSPAISIIAQNNLSKYRDSRRLERKVSGAEEKRIGKEEKKKKKNQET